MACTVTLNSRRLLARRSRRGTLAAERVPRRDLRSLGGHGPPPTGSCGEVATSSGVCADAAVLSSSARRECLGRLSQRQHHFVHPLSRRCRFLTICGSKLPRGRGAPRSRPDRPRSAWSWTAPRCESSRFPRRRGRASHNPDGRTQPLVEPDHPLVQFAVVVIPGPAPLEHRLASPDASDSAIALTARSKRTAPSFTHATSTSYRAKVGLYGTN
jgi:hypothetical protein